MAEMRDLDFHRDDFAPRAPVDVAQRCKCPDCGAWSPFSQWTYHNGTDSGYYCDDCNDFHSCFECPQCGEYFGAAGTYRESIVVEPCAVDREWRGTIHDGSTTRIPDDDTHPNHVRDAVEANR
jgi:hypothetical protein